MYLATLETRHFSFMAFGETEEQAREALRETWRKHKEQTGAEAAFYEYAEAGDVELLEVQAGDGFRDREKLR